MKIQETIENLKYLISGDCTDNQMDFVEEIEMGIKALEKQIPKKPDIEGDGYDENGELIYDTGFCPTCRHEFEVYYDATKYCPNCGQHLDWSDTEKGGASDE